jgi:5-methylcytosine-specific restriction enzyme subunit McrC
MIETRNIQIKNIFYMLTYAFQVLRQSTYAEISSEPFENIHNLFAAILSKGIAQQVKQGLFREYKPRIDDLPLLRGKLNIAGTISNHRQKKPDLVCEFDELTENNLHNQIFKTTILLLLREKHVDSDKKQDLKRVLLFFSNVETIDPLSIQWSRLIYSRNNQSYRMLLTICNFVLNDLLLTTEFGQHKMKLFNDDRGLARLFEKFVLEYYKFHFPHLHAYPSQVTWNLDNDYNEYLPSMKTDVMLFYKGKILIIDTKFYGRSMQTRADYDSLSIHSGNLYQIFTYVKNKDVGNTGNVSGLLLYAKTNESITPDVDYSISGSKISAKTLDLNQNFDSMANQLDSIVSQFFGPETLI